MPHLEIPLGKPILNNVEVRKCLFCTDDFNVPRKNKSQRFCSVQCVGKSQKNKIPWNKGIKGRKVWMNISGLRSHKIGEFIHTEESKRKNRIANLGRVAWNKGKPSGLSGSRHWNWQGGKTEERDRLRKTLEYKDWRLSVFLRDNKTCIICSSKKDIEADHIKPWSIFPELRFTLSNGRTLCHSCHVNTPTYFNNRSGFNQYTYGLFLSPILMYYHYKLSEISFDIGSSIPSL